MFSVEDQLDINNLEIFLDSNEENFENLEKEPNLFKNISNYFTGKSNIWYTYEYNEKTNEINYKFPRTFSRDFINLKKYFTSLIIKN